MINAIGAYIVILLALGIYQSKVKCTDIEEALNRYGTLGRSVLAAWLLALGWYNFRPESGLGNTWFGFVLLYIPSGFLLWIHESGHFFFIWANKFFHAAGGSLMQWFVPAVLAFRFWCKKLLVGFWTFSACLGVSLLSSVSYISDARAEKLPLLGGGEHDWHFMLGALGLLNADHFIASMFAILGWGILLPSVVMIVRNFRISGGGTGN